MLFKKMNLQCLCILNYKLNTEATSKVLRTEVQNMRREKILNTPYDDLVRIFDFDVNNKIFDFNFTSNTCNKLDTGICALEMFQKDMNSDYYDYCKREDFDLCIRAYLGLKYKITIGNLPILMMFKCGHYGFVDGQHRICVAQKMKMLLDIDFHENKEHYLCDICLNKENFPGKK